MASKRAGKHWLERPAVKMVQATFDPHGANQRTLGQGLLPAAMSGAHFNPSLARRGGDGDPVLGANDALTTTMASGATWSTFLTSRPPPNPESVERQSAQAKVQLISCHRERAPFNPRGAKPRHRRHSSLRDKQSLICKHQRL